MVLHQQPATKKNRQTEDIALAPTALEKAEANIAVLLAETEKLDDGKLETGQQSSYLRADDSQPLRWFMATDALAFLNSFIVTWLLVDVINLTFFNRSLYALGTDTNALHLGQFILIAFGITLWFETTGHYRLRMPFWFEAKKVMEAVGFAMVIDGFLQFATKQDFSRLWLVSSWFFAGIAIVVFRGIYRKQLSLQKRWQVPTLLLGNGTTASTALATLSDELSLGYKIMAKIDDVPQAFARAGESWSKLCTVYGVNYIIVALDGPDLTKADLALAQLMRENIPFSVFPSMRCLPVWVSMPHYFINHDVMLMPCNGSRKWSPLIKRLMPTSMPKVRPTNRS